MVNEQSPRSHKNSVKTVLIVDDEEPNRDLLEAWVEMLGHHTVCACSGREALERLDCEIDLVLLDIMMEDMDGYEVARRVRRHPTLSDIPIIMVTGLSSMEDRLKAVEAGANDFICKPVEQTELNVRLNSLLKMKDAQDEVKEYQAHLEQKVEERTRELHNALSNIQEAQQETFQAYLDTIERLAVAAEYRDEDTGDHIHRMSQYCVVLATGLGLPSEDIEIIRHASRMHDVGKIAIPDAILLKPGPLSDSEWELMKTHTVIGGRILSGSPSALLKAGRSIALSHHEKWDGSGYPCGLEGEAIPLSGRLAAVADVFDALTSERPYKEKFDNETAFGLMRAGDGAHFDPKVLQVFFECMEEILDIQKAFAEKNGSASG